MRHVNSKWLHVYNYILAGIDLLLFAVYGIFQFLDVSQATQDTWGITPLVLVICAIHLVYVLLIYPFARRRNEWIAHAIAQMLYGVFFSVVIETSGTDNMVYRVGFGIFVVMLNMVGPYLAIAAVTLMWMILTFDILSVIQGAPSPILFNVIIDTIISICAFLGWLFFRRYYLKDKETAQLTNLLEQEQVKSSIVLESITDGVIVVNTRGATQIINIAAANMFGWSKSEARGMPYTSLYSIVEQDKLGSAQQNNGDDAVALTLQTGKPHQKVIQLHSHNNKYRYIDVVASPIYQDTIAEAEHPEARKLVGVIAVYRDVDQQKREEQQRTEFISTASHEMRTPVAAIEGYLALAMNDKVCLIDEKARGYLDKAHASTQHLGQLFQDLLTSAKADDGRLANHPKVIEFSSYLEKLVEDLRFSAEKKGLALEFVMGTDQENIAINTTSTKMVKPLYYIEADPDRLREVITNLFDNAVKYTPSGKITIGLTGNGEVVQFYIKDTGSGIAAEDVPHLFQKFYRIDNSTTRTVGGTGLGLFICRKIVELYNGRIWVESQPGKGSTFFVNLPRLDTAVAESARPQQPASPASTVVQ